MTNRTCYLCGEVGADTRDHVPPKCFLPQGVPGTTQRLTIWAHRQCNEGFSKDEEYVRDLIGPTATQYPDGQRVYQNTNRSWGDPQGKKRLRRILSASTTGYLRSPAGLIVGRGIIIKPEVARLERIGRKISQGVIFSDTYNFAAPQGIIVAPIMTQYVPEERERGLRDSNPFWQLLASDECRHDNFSHSVAVRRGYFVEDIEPVIRCAVAMVIMLYSQSFVIMGEIKLKVTPPEGFYMFALKSDVESDAAGDEVA